MRHIGNGSQVKTQNSFMFHVYLIPCQKVILCNIFNNFVHETKFYSVEISICGTRLVPKEFWILERLDFKVLD
jgi:hypothetical protein